MKLRNCLFLLCAFALMGCATEGNDETPSNDTPPETSGTSQKPGTSSTGNTSAPIKPAPKAYSVGDSCNEDTYGMFCDGTRVVKCQEGKVLMVDCADYDGVCEIFADFPNLADCVYLDDETCDNPGKVTKECKLNEYWEEVLVTTTCSMSSNNKAYEFVNSIACAEACSGSKGCYAATCSGEYSSCSADGKWLSYCHEGKQYTVNCANIDGASCIVNGDGVADCDVDWDKY